MKPSTALVQQIWDAWSTLDPRNVAQYYAADAPFPFYDIFPMKFDTWPAFEKGAVDMFGGFSSMKATINHAVVRTNGSGALGTAVVHLDMVRKDGTPVSMDVRWTGVWEQKDGRWLIVHEHVSVPMAAPKPKS